MKKKNILKTAVFSVLIVGGFFAIRAAVLVGVDSSTQLAETISSIPVSNFGPSVVQTQYKSSLSNDYSCVKDAKSTSSCYKLQKKVEESSSMEVLPQGLLTANLILNVALSQNSIIPIELRDLETAWHTRTTTTKIQNNVSMHYFKESWAPLPFSTYTREDWYNHQIIHEKETSKDGNEVELVPGGEHIGSYTDSYTIGDYKRSAYKMETSRSYLIGFKYDKVEKGQYISTKSYKIKLRLELYKIYVDSKTHEETTAPISCSGATVAGQTVASDCTTTITLHGPALLKEVTPKTSASYYGYKVSVISVQTVPDK